MAEIPDYQWKHLVALVKEYDISVTEHKGIDSLYCAVSVLDILLDVVREHERTEPCIPTDIQQSQA